MYEPRFVLRLRVYIICVNVMLMHIIMQLLHVSHLTPVYHASYFTFQCLEFISCDINHLLVRVCPYRYTRIYSYKKPPRALALDFLI